MGHLTNACSILWCAVALWCTMVGSVQAGWVIRPLSGGGGLTPVADYQLEEGSGTTAGDSAASPLDGTLTNGPAWVAGLYDTWAVDFDGTDDIIDIGSSASGKLDFTSGPFSIEACVNNDTLVGADTIVGKRHAGHSQYAFLVGNVPTRLGFNSASGETYAEYSFATSTTYHVVVTVSATNSLTFYVNGSSQAISSGSNPVTITSNETRVTIGSRWNTEHSTVMSAWDGRIDYVRFYDVELTSGQVTTLLGDCS